LLLGSETNSETGFTVVGGGGTWAAPVDDTYSAVAWTQFAASYATNHALNVEDMWLHVRSGDPNCSAGIWSVTTGGAILFW